MLKVKVLLRCFQMILLITQHCQSHCLLTERSLHLKTALLPATPTPQTLPTTHTTRHSKPSQHLTRWPFSVLSKSRPVISLKHNTMENSSPSVPLVYIVSIRPSVFMWRLCEGALSSCAAVRGDRLAFIMCDDVHLQETQSEIILLLCRGHISIQTGWLEKIEKKIPNKKNTNGFDQKNKSRTNSEIARSYTVSISRCELFRPSPPHHHHLWSWARAKSRAVDGGAIRS